MKLANQAIFRDIPTNLRAGLQFIWEEIARVVNGKVDIQTFTETTKPAATDVPVATIIYISDGADGDRMRYSDGTVWRTLG